MHLNPHASSLTNIMLIPLWSWVIQETDWATEEQVAFPVDEIECFWEQYFIFLWGTEYCSKEAVPPQSGAKEITELSAQLDVILWSWELHGKWQSLGNHNDSATRSSL